jgi:acetoin utilization protein AcuC
MDEATNSTSHSSRSLKERATSRSSRRWFRARSANSLPQFSSCRPGADAHVDDPLADLMLTTLDYERIFHLILGWAGEHTGGRVLFTLGGGYSFRATPRVWTLLYLLLPDLPVPKELPEAWRTRWSAAMGGHPPPTNFHDAPLPANAVTARAEIERRNRQTADRLFEAVRPYWF